MWGVVGKGNHGCEGGNHPAHSPDLAPSDDHLFLHLAGHKLHEDQVTTRLRAKATEFVTSE